jgi:hypothetical protein
MGWCGPPHTYSFTWLDPVRIEAKFASFKLNRNRIFRFSILGKLLFQRIFALGLNRKLSLEDGANGSGSNLRGSDRGGRSRGLHKTEIESTDYVETFMSLKSITLFFLVIVRNKKRQKDICRNQNFLLLIGASSFRLSRGAHICKFCFGTAR